MKERNVIELLESAAEQVPVGPPPVASMVRGARRSRLRRGMAVALTSVATAAAVAAVVLGTTVLGGRSSGPDRAPVAEGPTPSVAQQPGVRLVGLGQVAIAVPEEWGTNQTHCGVPQRDTVVIDVAAVQACLVGRETRVESVEVSSGKPRFDFEADEEVVVDGIAAERQATTCRRDVGRVRVCTGTVHIPSMEVWFRAESSTGAATVDEILSWIRHVPDRVGVPGHQEVAGMAQARSGAKYVEELRAVGLGVEVRTVKEPGLPAGLVRDASPAPGTMVEPGSVVTVTVVAEPEGPEDELTVGVNSSTAGGDDYVSRDDAQIRAGATIRLKVGDEIWAYAQGKRSGTLAGELQGDSLEISDWVEGPNHPHSWVATRPGRTTITLTITADGERVVLGTVTVLVEGSS